MMLVEVAPVATGALPVAGLKDHLRLGSGFTDDGLQDGLLEGFLRAALATIEGRTGKALLTRAFTLTLAAWRAGDRQVLPLAPVSAVTALVLIDALGAETAVPGGAWRLLPDMHRPCLAAITGALPTIPPHGAARIALTAGYGPAWSDLPPDLRQAVLLLAAHYYEYRQDTALGAGCMPFGVTALIERYRSPRLTLGGAA
jgi:uncharacterized phiE125 gp8 family phage protein